MSVDTWIQYPIGGEFASTHEDSYFLVTDYDLTLESIIDSHQSFIGPKIIIDESETDYSRAMNEILKTIGYRYYVANVAVDFNDKEAFTISCTMGNDGIAPIYQQYYIELSIIDDDGNEIWISDSIDADLRKLLPNEQMTFACEVDREDFDDDTMYHLIISIVDGSNHAIVPLANTTEVEGKQYQIASFAIK